MEQILLYDTTLRDGTQGEKINFTALDKMKIARKLDDLGIHYIEGGWPGANDKDREFFETAKNENFRKSRRCLFESIAMDRILLIDYEGVTKSLHKSAIPIDELGQCINDQVDDSRLEVQPHEASVV